MYSMVVQIYNEPVFKQENLNAGKNFTSARLETQILSLFRQLLIQSQTNFFLSQVVRVWYVYH